MIDSSTVRVLSNARQLAAEIYRLTAALPDVERFGLIAQMRRAAISIGSNIAEACGRHGDRSLAYFLDIAKGSTSELAFQLEICVDLGFIEKDQAITPRHKIDELSRRLNRFVTVVKARAKATAR